MKEDGRFSRLFKCQYILDNIISVVFDEAHCIALWGTFRPEYCEVARLKYRMHKDTPFALVSATLPKLVRNRLCQILHLEEGKFTEIRRTTDRHNIFLTVREMQHAVGSYKDLAFLIPTDIPRLRPPKFIIFFNGIHEATSAAKFLWGLAGKENKPEEQIIWYHSNMSEDFKQGEVERLRSGELWGICATDAFGLVRHSPICTRLTADVFSQGMDLSNITTIINYGAVYCDLCKITQRFGRAVRDNRLQGYALLLFEPKYSDKTRALKAKKKTDKDRRVSERKRKRVEKGANNRANKRQAIGATHPHAGSLPSIGEAGQHLASGREEHEEEDGEGVEFEGAQGAEVAAEEENMMQVDESIDVVVVDEPPGGGEGQEGTADTLLEDDATLRAKYGTTRGTVKKKEIALEEAMEDFINAGERSLGCRRRIMNVYFDAARAGEYALPNSLAISHTLPSSLTRQPTTTSLATPPYLTAVLAAPHLRPRFAAIFVSQTILYSICSLLPRPLCRPKHYRALTSPPPTIRSRWTRRWLRSSTTGGCGRH